MKRKNLYISLCFIGAFALWTALVLNVDVREVGPNGSVVGFATVNIFVHRLTGVNFSLYNVTDWLGIVPIGVMLSFASLGLVQWIKRKKLRSVDGGILVLGGFYVAVSFVYVFFEIFEVNYRPVLINGYLEASYPSSTTVLVMCVMPTAYMQIKKRINNKALCGCVCVAITSFTVFMVIGRLVSGVHWVTDIIGGALISTGLVMMYRFANAIAFEQQNNP